ncbi:MAG: M23 family metallopeptidase [Anaerolineaceae bacterium]|nr:M23 family metallopeptidase [Anaerolineaceae bacterium]
MSDITNPLASFRAINNLNFLEKKSDIAGTSGSASTSTESLKETFQQMLMLTMMSGMSSSSSEGTNSSSMMMPLMLSLLEKLISETVEKGDSAQSTTTSATGITTSTNSVKETPAPQTESKNQPSGRPVSGGRLTQGYHTGHLALDFGIPVGTDVKTTMDGKVVYAGWNNEGYGNLVIVENGPYRTYYAHLSEIPVHLGESVSAGSTIGLSGNTGNSTGPHLHYEVRYQMSHIDPTSFTLNG